LHKLYTLLTIKDHYDLSSVKLNVLKKIRDKVEIDLKDYIDELIL